MAPDPLTIEEIRQRLADMRAARVETAALGLARLIEDMIDAADTAPADHWHEIVGARMGKLREAVRRG